MNQQAYIKPTMTVVKIQQTHIVCASQVRSVGGNADITYDPNNGGGSLSFVETAQPQVIVPQWITPALAGAAGVIVLLLAVIVIQAVKIKKLKK